MNFEQVSQNGIVPPTSYFNKQSKFAVIISSTGTVVGQPLILKAISDADIYHEQPVVFYVSTNSGAVVELGQATWTGNFAPLVTTGLSTGTNSIYATWPGQDKFAPQSTINSPSTVTVASGYPLGGTMTISATPASGSIVVDEGTATFLVVFSTSTQITTPVQFYDNNKFLGNASITNNSATFSISTWSVGINTVTAIWPGQTIGGRPYAGQQTSVDYSILSGTNVTSQFVLSATPNYGVVNEESVTLTASISSSTQYAGNVNFYNSSTLLATVAVADNSAQTNVNITSLGNTGTYILRAVWDGNQTSHPRYIPQTTNSLSFNVLDRRTLSSNVLTVTPNPDVADFQVPTLSVALDGLVGPINGLVNFYDNGQLIASTATVGNVATITYPQITTGSHVITSAYGGSSNAPKYYASTSNQVTLNVVSAFAYPGTMTLSGPSSFNKLSGNETLTLTGSVNTLTSGLVTLSQIITTATTTLRTLSTASFTGTNVVKLTFNPNNLINPPTWYSFTSTNYQMLVGTTSFDNNGLYVNTYASILSSTITVDYLKSNPMYFTVNSSLPAYQNIIFQIDTAHVELIGTDAGKNLVGFLFYPVTTITYTPSFYPDVNDTTGYSATFNKGIAHTTSTNVFNIVATWAGQGIPSLGYTPYYGTNSNIITQTVNSSTLTLSGSTTSNNIAYANTFTVTVNTSSIVANTVRLYNGSSVVATSSITTGNNVVVTLSAGTLPIGTNTISAVLTTTNQTVTSNSISKVIVGAGATDLSVTNSTSTYNYYTSTGTVNSVSLTTTVNLTGQNANHSPLGNVVLKTSTGTVIVSASATSISSTVSQVSFTWSPIFLGVGDQTLIVQYQDDVWNASASTSTTITALKNKAIITASSTNLNTSGYFIGQYYGSVSFTATFVVLSSAPTSVNWSINGGFVTSTPVVNGQAYFNNVGLGTPGGTYYIDATYTETDIYAGSNQLAVTEAPAAQLNPNFTYYLGNNNNGVAVYSYSYSLPYGADLATYGASSITFTLTTYWLNVQTGGNEVQTHTATGSTSGNSVSITYGTRGYPWAFLRNEIHIHADAVSGGATAINI